MARTAATLSKGAGISYDISISVLCQIFPRLTVSNILKSTNKESQRRRDFPADMVVYYVVAMCLFMTVNLREVLRCLMEGLAFIFPKEQIKVTGKSGISQARTRLGVEPMRQLYENCVVPIGTTKTIGCFYKQWRLVSLDGSTLDVADEASNREAFGKMGAKNGKSSPYPQIRVVSLVENGTHVLFGARMTNLKVGEGTLAKEVLKESLKPGMLCFADRLFFGFELWQLALSRGASLLWRMRACSILKVEKRLSDGSYLSRIYNNGKKSTAQVVRVIIYTIEGSSETYRLITNILDPQEISALELAALYHERWEIETTFDELKTHMRGAHICLRSKTKDLVEQEFYGLMLAHFLLRYIMHQAAIVAEEDPDRLSYTHTLNVVRRKIRVFRGFSPCEDTTDVFSDL